MAKTSRELVLSVTEKDCKFTFTTASKSGGQKVNKTSSAARCKHIESGAVGYCQDTRSQRQNKIIAFNRMSQTKEFNEWHVKKLAEIFDICDPDDLKVG